MLQQLREVGHQLEELGRTESGIQQKKEATLEEVRHLRNERDGNVFISPQIFVTPVGLNNSIDFGLKIYVQRESFLELVGKISLFS